jgi:hypothetical protein
MENRKLQVETPSAGQMPPMPAAEAQQLITRRRQTICRSKIKNIFFQIPN